MKKNIVIFITTIILVGLTACSSNTQSQKTYRGAPKIVINDENYFAYSLEIITELPEEYVYAGELSEVELEYANIIGNKYYIKENQEVLTHFYVYQECGTKISENELDNTQRQWAYMQWRLEE